jgi:hypothetical protein
MKCNELGSGLLSNDIIRYVPYFLPESGRRWRRSRSRRRRRTRRMTTT